MKPLRGQSTKEDQEIIHRRYRRARHYCDFKGKTVVDFGCGNGTQGILFDDVNSMVGLDIDMKDINDYIVKLKQKKIKNVNPICYDGGIAPIPDQYADIIISFEVLEHTQDESLALSELYRMLKIGGELIISVPNKAWIFETHGAHLPFKIWHRVPFFSWLPRPIHERFANARIYRQSQIIELLSTHGFSVLASEYTTAPMDIVKWVWLKKLLRKVIFRGDTTSIPFLSTSIICYCKK